MATSWELRAIDDNSAELILWDSLRGNDIFIRLDGLTGEVTVRDHNGVRKVQSLVIFLNDFAQVYELEGA